MRKFMIALCALLAMAGTAWAEQGPQLFKDYYYGMSKEEVAKLSGAVPCQDAELIGSLCMPTPVKFGGEEWQQIFVMDNDRLGKVALARADDIQVFQTMIQVISKSGYLLLFVNAGNEQVDVLAYAKQGQQALMNRLGEIFARMEGNITCSFLEEKAVTSIRNEYKVNGVFDLLSNASRNLREVDLARIDGVLALNFLAPVAAQEDLERKTGELKESF